MANFFRSISYNPLLVKLVKFLKLRNFLRKLYYSIFCPKDNILSISISGISAKFYVRNPDELRLVESVTGAKGEKKVLENFISSLREGDIVYDVGANVGAYSIILAKAVGSGGKIIAFEPERTSIARLRENIALNRLNNIAVVEKALGEKYGQAKLFISGTTGNFSLVNIYDKETKSEDVETVKGDDFVGENKLPDCNALKVDVEGYEYSVLKGLEKIISKPSCRVICCEIHLGLFPEGITEGKIIEFIKEAGFENIIQFKREFSAYHIVASKK